MTCIPYTQDVPGDVDSSRGRGVTDRTGELKFERNAVQEELGMGNGQKKE